MGVRPGDGAGRGPKCGWRQGQAGPWVAQRAVRPITG